MRGGGGGRGAGVGRRGAGDKEGASAADDGEVAALRVGLIVTYLVYKFTLHKEFCFRY